YFLPFIFNQSETQARDDYIDIHGSRIRGFSADDPAYQRFAAAASQAAAIFEQTRNAPQQVWFHQVARSLRMWLSVMESVRNFVAGQRVRDALGDALHGPPPATFKGSTPGGDPNY